MKDAKGHGSDGKGGGVFNRDSAREFANRIGLTSDSKVQAAAHQSMVGKVLASGDVHGAMAHAVTGYDRQQSERATTKGSYYNHNALGLYLGAVERAAKDIKSGTPHVDAINSHFNGALANRLHKALKTGGKDIDSMRRDSFRSSVGNTKARY